MFKYVKIGICTACVALFALLLPNLHVNPANAEICFLPDGKGCDTVPYNEGGYIPPDPGPGPTPTPTCQVSQNCFDNETAAKNSRSDELDSYKSQNGCYCLKSSCSLAAYSETSKKTTGYWECPACSDANSKWYNTRFNCSCPLGTSNYTGFTASSCSCNDGYTKNNNNKCVKEYIFAFDGENGPTQKWYNIGADGGSITDVVIYSKNYKGENVAYNASKEGDWITLSTSDMSATIGKNTTSQERSSTVTFTQSNSGNKITAKVTQQGGLCPEGYSIYTTAANCGSNQYLATNGVLDGKQCGKCLDKPTQPQNDEFCIVFNYHCGNKTCSDEVINGIGLTPNFSTGEDLISSKVEHKKYCFHKSSITDSDDNSIYINRMKYHKTYNKGSGERKLYYVHATSYEGDAYAGTDENIKNLVINDYFIDSFSFYLREDRPIQGEYDSDVEFYVFYNDFYPQKFQGKVISVYELRKETEDVKTCKKECKDSDDELCEWMCDASEITGDMNLDVFVTEFKEQNRCITVDLTCHEARYPDMRFNDCADVAFYSYASTDKNEVYMDEDGDGTSSFQAKKYPANLESIDGENFRFKACGIPSYDAGYLDIRAKPIEYLNTDTKINEIGGFTFVTDGKADIRNFGSPSQYSEREIFIGFGDDKSFEDELYPHISLAVNAMDIWKTDYPNGANPAQVTSIYCENARDYAVIRSNRKLPFDLVVDAMVQFRVDNYTHYNGSSYTHNYSYTEKAGKFNTCEVEPNSIYSNWAGHGPQLPSSCDTDNRYHELLFKKDSKQALLYGTYDNSYLNSIRCNFSWNGGSYNSNLVEFGGGNFGIESIGVTKVYTKDHYDGRDGVPLGENVPGTNWYITWDSYGTKR